MAEGAHTPQKSGSFVKIAIAAIVVVGLVVAGIVLFGGKDAATTTTRGGTKVDPTTPEFDFGHAKAVVITTTPDQDPKALTKVAAGASKDTLAVLDTVYTEAFLDPSSWKDGSYDDAWAQFSEAASAKAQTDVETLTAGTDVGGTYDTIDPVKGTAKVRVLIDAKGKPLSAVGIVFFTAKGMRADGSFTLFKSTGQYFLQMQADAWTIVSYEVSRDDQEREAKPSPVPSSSGSATESPS